MWLFLLVLCFWAGAFFGGRSLYKTWRHGRVLQPARYLKEIVSVDYYHRLSRAQFESLVMQVIKARNFTLLGDPCLGRAKEQGYAWKEGKRIVFVYCLESPLTLSELEDIAKRSRRAQAEQALVFSPFPKAPRGRHDGVDVLAGKELLSWFSAIGEVSPPLVGRLPAEKCQCGSPMKQRVSRAGRPLLVCSLFPDCRT